MATALEDPIRSIGSQLLESARREDARLAKEHSLEMSLLDWCMQNTELKVRTFQFIDLFPDLRSSGAVLEHIQEYFPSSENRFPKILRALLSLTRPKFLAQEPARLISRNLYLRMAKLFIGGADEKDALRLLREMEKDNVRLSLDLLGESTASVEEADRYFARYEALIKTLGSQKSGFLKQNVSIKLSALDPFFDAIDAGGTSRRIREKLRKLVRLAQSQEVFLHIDMEEYCHRDLTLQIMRELSEEDEFRGGFHFGLVLQAYLKDSENCLSETLRWATKLPIPPTIRLVRGAYWDTEIMRAEENRWPLPVFTHKNDTDRTFERLTERILDAIPKVRLAVATHNIRSIAHALVLSEIKRTPPDFLEFQLLYGMGASLVKPLLERGLTPRLYTPIGDPIRGMAYLVRRLLENVSSESFVRQGIHRKNDPAELLKPPVVIASETEGGILKKARSLAKALDDNYYRTPPLEFHKSDVCDTFQRSLKEMKTKFERSLRGKTPRADRKSVLPAITSAEKAFLKWTETPVASRAECLKKAARFLKDRRYRLSALQVFEVGKPWREADADVCEAIDYLNFYAEAALKIEHDEATEKLTGETDILRPRGRGIAVVIAPWNFPMAIFAGMSAAALVTGNTVLLKPSALSVLSAQEVFRAYEASGVPKGVIHFLPGNGNEIGPLLVQDPRVALIAFTGSKEVGTEIISMANLKTSGQERIKKVIVEMGGKNAAIVDRSADLDQAIPAILQSAFGYAGQKCSALSRLIVLEPIYETFIARLTNAAASFKVGDPSDPRTQCGPVIDQNAQGKIEAYIEEGKKTGRVLFQGKVPEGLAGHFVPPVIISDLPEDSRLLKEEIFGPVLCVIRVKTFQEALKRANEVEFALTGGVFSRTPSHIELAKSKFEAGNLYVNRPITGAVVGRQPFGGYKMSGGGTKAGGINYLREFFIERTVSENTSRHGFVPD